MFTLRTSETPTLQLSAEELVLIDSNWNTFLTTRTITENDTLLRYLGHDDTTIEVAPDVTYKDVVSMRFGRKPTTAPFLVLSAIALVRTRDGHTILQLRDSGDWPRSLELPGGFIRAHMIQDTTTSFITTRVARDLAIAITDIQHVTLLDIYSFPEILEKMLVFEVVLTQTKGELLDSTKDIYLLPDSYSTENHDQYFNTTLHYPSKVILDTFYHQSTFTVDEYKSLVP